MDSHEDDATVDLTWNYALWFEKYGEAILLVFLNKYKKKVAVLRCLMYFCKSLVSILVGIAIIVYSEV